MDLFWIIIILILATGLLAYRNYRNPQVDVHEGNHIKVQFRLWSTWLTGLLMFVLGYTLDKPWIQGGSEQEGLYPLWINYAVMGFLVFNIALMFALPNIKKEASGSKKK